MNDTHMGKDISGLGGAYKNFSGGKLRQWVKESLSKIVKTSPTRMLLENKI